MVRSTPEWSAARLRQTGNAKRCDAALQTKRPPIGGRLSKPMKPLPPAIHHEIAGAATVHPDAGAIPAPGAALDARGTGDLPPEGNAAPAAHVHLAEVVVEILAPAGNFKATIPARRRCPATRTTRPVTGGREARTATLVHPYAVAAFAPGLAADASASGNLLDDADVAVPGNPATVVLAILAFADDGLAAIVIPVTGRCP